jgi:hypothetical protein
METQLISGRVMDYMCSTRRSSSEYSGFDMSMRSVLLASLEWLATPQARLVIRRRSMAGNSRI